MIDDKETADRIVDGLREAYPQYVKAAIVEALEAKQRQIDRLQSDLKFMSGIMREYSQGFFNVCEQIKAMEATNGQG